MESPENIEADPFADNIVLVTEGDEQFAEAVGELLEDQGLDGQAGPGMPLEAGDGHDGPPDRALLVWTRTRGRTWGTAMSPQLLDPLRAPYRESRKLAPCPISNLVPPVALPAQPLSVSGAYAHAPPIGAMPGVWSRLPDPSELYVLPRMPYSCAGYLPAPAGRMMPAPITVTARTTVTTTVTSSIAISAVQAGLVYPAYTGPRAPTPGICNSSWIRSTCRSSVSYWLDLRGSEGSRGLWLT